MLPKIIKKSFANQKKAIALMVISIAVGTAMAASLITITLDITGKVSKELRSFGANIVVEPKIEGIADISGQKRHLKQEDIVKTKAIFWRHNILGVSPFLESEAMIIRNGNARQVKIIGAWYEKDLPLPGEANYFSAGIKTVFPWWNIAGEWPESKNKLAIGSRLADEIKISIGEHLEIDGEVFTVSGIIETGGPEENQIFMELESLQALKNKAGKISKVFISALTTPMDDFAYRDPNTMTKAEYEKWYCTGYVTSIAKQVEEVFEGSRAKPVWQVAETEGNVLTKLRLLIYLLCFTIIIASAVCVTTTMIMSLLRRTKEIGLMKAIGADSIKIITIFFSEGILIGILGGLAGYGLSILLSKYIGLKVFDAALAQRSMLLPIAIGSAIIISIGGIIIPIKRALRISANSALKGGI